MRWTATGGVGAKGAGLVSAAFGVAGAAGTDGDDWTGAGCTTVGAGVAALGVGAGGAAITGAALGVGTGAETGAGVE